MRRQRKVFLTDLEINVYTNEHHKESQMLSGHLQGKLLEMISRMVRPRRILEIGTFTGYSALCLAKGLTEAGQLHTIELRENDAATAKGFFNRSRDQRLYKRASQGIANAQRAFAGKTAGNDQPDGTAASHFRNWNIYGI